MNSLEQIRDTIAKREGRNSWEEWSWVASEPYGKDIPQKFNDEAWQTYSVELAREAWRDGYVRKLMEGTITDPNLAEALNHTFPPTEEAWLKNKGI